MIPPGGFRVIKSIRKRKRKGRKVDTGFRIDLPDLPQVARVAFTPPPPTVRIKAPPRYLIRPPMPPPAPVEAPIHGYTLYPTLCDNLLTILPRTRTVTRTVTRTETVPAAILLVIDVSGSMGDGNGEKLEAAKNGVYSVIDELNPGDTLGVVTFANSTSTIIDVNQPFNETQARAKIAALRASGGTNMYAGLQLAQTELQTATQQVKLVILLADGQPNQGTTSVSAFTTLATTIKDAGTIVTTVGTGANLPASATALLEAIAQAGGGQYHAAPDPNNIPDIFDNTLTLRTITHTVTETVNIPIGEPLPVVGYQLPPIFCHPIVEPPSQAIYPGITLPPVFCEVIRPVEPPPPIYGSTILPILCDMGPTFPQPQTFAELQLPPVGGVPPSPPPKIYPGLTLPPIKC